MSTKSSIYCEFSDSKELHIFYEPGINYPEAGIYIYTRTGDGETLWRVTDPKLLSDELLKDPECRKTLTLQ